VFDLVVARTGLNDAEARQAGLDPLTVEEQVWDHKVYEGVNQGVIGVHSDFH
jgi:hypothetical protein